MSRATSCRQPRWWRRKRTHRPVRRCRCGRNWVWVPDYHGGEWRHR